MDTTDFDPNNGDRSLVQACAQMLRDGIHQGVEAVKGILKRWSTDLRWCAVLLLEETAAQQLRRLEELVPQFYTLLSEEVLPMEGANG
ncbi:MAG: hypothetical protein KME21_24405 [Desmonostoc vinosum HA7617-LM4]|nr:hypothetical protein [Desmonostoc vinosum HA7617-LM4]